MIKPYLKPFLQIFLDNQSAQKQLFNLAEFVLSSAKITKFADEGPINLAKLSWQDISFGSNIKEDVAKKYHFSLQNDKKLQEELEYIKQENINITSFYDEAYPTKLKEITCPPFFLFHRGALDESSWNFAIVGARKCSEYGRHAVLKIIPDLIKNNATIVSGGAEGIDSIAHEATIKLGGKTIVIVGSGLGTTYPLKNKKLFKDVVNYGGCELSIFPSQTPPHKINFPIRNRVIAGLAEGILVVEASVKSGSLITAKFGLDENRDIFAIPGPINSVLSSGCNKLLKNGAILVEEANDVLEVYSSRSDLKKYIKLDSISSNNNCTETETKEVSSTPTASNDCQTIILQRLKFAKNMDELVLETGFSEEEILNELFNLELDNLIKQDFTGKWKII